MRLALPSITLWKNRQHRHSHKAILRLHMWRPSVLAPERPVQAEGTASAWKT